MEIPHCLLKLPESTLAGSREVNQDILTDWKSSIFGWCQSRFSMIFHDFPWFSHSTMAIFSGLIFRTKFISPWFSPWFSHENPHDPPLGWCQVTEGRDEVQKRLLALSDLVPNKNRDFPQENHGKLRISSPKIWRWGYNELWMGLGIIYVYRYLYNSKWI